MGGGTAAGATSHTKTSTLLLTMSTASTEEGKLPNERAKMTECSSVELAMLKWTRDLHSHPGGDISRISFFLVFARGFLSALPVRVRARQTQLRLRESNA